MKQEFYNCKYADIYCTDYDWCTRHDRINTKQCEDCEEFQATKPINYTNCKHFRISNISHVTQPCLHNHEKKECIYQNLKNKGECFDNGASCPNYDLPYHKSFNGNTRLTKQRHMSNQIIYENIRKKALFMEDIIQTLTKHPETINKNICTTLKTCTDEIITEQEKIK